MAKLTITISTDNTAFFDDSGYYDAEPEIRRILANIDLEKSYLYDVNGNKVGTINFRPRIINNQLSEEG